MSLNGGAGSRPKAWKPGARSAGAGSAELKLEPQAASRSEFELRAQPKPALAASSEPGWYVEPSHPGVLRYWSGRQWEEWRVPLVSPPSAAQGQRDLATTYVLAIPLGMFGAHNFYLGRVGIAVTQLLLTIAGALTSWLIIGLFPLAAVAVWVIIDWCLIPSFVRASALKAIRFNANSSSIR